MTEELIPGFRASTCAFVAGPGSNRGSSPTWGWPGTDSTSTRAIRWDQHQRAGESFGVYRELDRTLAEIERAFGRGDVEGLSGSEPGCNGSQRSSGRPFSATRRPSTELRAGSTAPASALFDPFIPAGRRPAGRYVEADPLKGFLAFLGLTSVYGGPWTPGTAYVFSHHSWGEFDGRFGEFGFVRGGMGAISEALGAAARASGVVIRTGAEVERIIVADGRAVGVVAGGEEPRIRRGRLQRRPQTHLPLAGRRTDLPAQFVERVRGIDYRGTMARVHVAVDRLPRVHRLSGGRVGAHRVTLLGADLEALERAWAAQQAGEMPDDPAIEFTIQSVHDDALAPAGRHIITTGLQQLPFELADGTWDDGRAPGAEAIEAIENYAPGFEAPVIGTHTITPLDLERDYGLTAGNIFHGAMTKEQLFAERPLGGYGTYRSPIAGLYLCGAGTHPGGGVTGGPGHNSARAVLEISASPSPVRPGPGRAPAVGRYQRLGRLLDRPGCSG